MPARTEPSRELRAGPDAQTWRARAFGLGIEGSFPAPGLEPTTVASDAPRTVVELLATDAIRRLGSVLGHSEKTYVAVQREDDPAPLGAVHFLRAVDRPLAEPIERMPAPDPRLLLASTFVYSVQSPERLRNQLDVCAELARSVPAFSAAVAPGGGAEELADAIATHARTVAAGGA